MSINANARSQRRRLSFVPLALWNCLWLVPRRSTFCKRRRQGIFQLNIDYITK